MFNVCCFVLIVSDLENVLSSRDCEDKKVL